jgi:hypothetical protein
MPICEKCRSEFQLFDLNGNQSLIPICPNNCQRDKMLEKEAQIENDKSMMQIIDEHEEMFRGNNLVLKTDSHCWTYIAEGRPCPGVIRRTPETQDGIYGNFCPVCGYSLRFHYFYGEKKSGDLALRYR